MWGNGGLRLPLLQFVDDSIFFFRNEIRDYITLKMILGCFEMASRLKVNFHKSCLIVFTWSKGRP